ncbi:MAG: sugar phosphate nucleotidyltransferase [Fimbriimonadales bacterium]
MKGVILAAGKGTRLYPITKRIPKPLLPIANRPTIEYAFDKLRELSVEDVCIIVGENEPQMRESLGDGSRYGLRLSYAKQPEPKGLAHAVSFARDQIQDSPFILYLGDAIYGDSLVSLRDRFLESECANLNMVKQVDDPRRFGVANVEGERIVRLVEKPQHPESNLAMAGVYFFRKQIWDTFETLQPSARGEYEITDAIQMLVDRGETVLAGEYEGSWFDTGTLDSFLECSSYLTQRKPLFGSNLLLSCEVEENVSIGQDSVVNCKQIADTTVMPGSRISVTGTIRHCILAGDIEHVGSLENVVMDSALT